MTIDPTENVLVIMSDEHQRRAMSGVGHPVVQTPNLDALAASGTSFSNCWTPSPICVPARASFATGRWVHDVKAWDSAQAYTGTPRGWAHTMRDAGHEVASMGKLHHRAATDDDGFTDRLLPMFIAGGIGWVQGLSRDNPIPYHENGELAADVGRGHTSYTRYDQRVTNAAVDWIKSPDRSKPWTAFVSLVAPHYPLSAPQEFTDLYPLSEVPPPEIAPIAPTHPANAGLASFFNYHDSFDEDSTRRARRAYFALCSWMDHNVGRVLEALEESGQRSNTRIIYTSDHGEMLGNRGLWCKSFMFEDSVAVPLIISGPGIPAGRQISTNTSLVDIAPTVTEVVSVQNPDQPKCSGRSLTELAEVEDHERLGFSEYHDGGSITGSFAVRVGQWKYIEHVGFEPQLFDLDEDPDELNDLGTAAGLKSARNDCAEALRSIVDPEQANRIAFASQKSLLDRLGGRDAVASGVRFNHTPAPTLDPR